MANKKEISSGAEKAEKLAGSNKSKSQGAKKNKAQTVKSKEQSKEKGDVVVKENAPEKKVSAKKQTQQKLKAQKKLHDEKMRQEKKERRLEKKLEHKNKKLERIAVFKEKQAQRKAQAKERRDLLKNESKQERIARKAEEKQAKIEARVAKHKQLVAEKEAKREHKLRLKEERRAEKNDKRQSPGFGGWLAAVIALGVTTLTLGTLVTFGWMNMNGMQATMASEQVESLYELNSVIDNLDTNLSKARVASSNSDRVRILTDIAIESEMAEVILERMPLDITMTEEMTSFINKMSDSAQNMIYTIAIGGELTPSQVKSISYMYETNLQLKRAINEVIANVKNNDILSLMRGKGSVISDSFSDIQNNVIEQPKGIQDGPFSDSIKTEGATAVDGLEEITAHKAEELAKDYFNDYKVTQITCTGEAVAKGITCYNVCMTTDDGDMLAQLSKQGGLVVMFDSYKDCESKNFSVERCTTIAEDFLSELGYKNLKAVWTSENGTTCNLNFAPVQDGVIIYPDLIKVKVCEERGIVTGLEARSYILNHSARNLDEAQLSKDEAQSKINGNIDVKIARLALIPLNEQEVLCYEFYGMIGESEYYIYVDASTGEEVEVLTVIGTAQGRALM